ncbi:hypothetical protein HOLleu_01018 [Holothuria leucospilota]|uniref:Uncharacterized protein n=1 Tax=Holothuria leucospilota TaxID=206669 RepID=A0A9Q1HKL0_HOLLE|nr:hypothetical protein HOLleu_01018 [Holothuria leucospilota]
MTGSKSFKRGIHKAIRKPEALSASRARMMNETVKSQYFDLLSKVENDLGLTNKPAQIFNADESGFSLVRKPQKVVSEKGKKQVHAKTSGERGVNTTVLLAASATGVFIPLFLSSRVKGYHRH